MRWVGPTVLSLVIVGCTGSSTPATTPTSVTTTSTSTTTIATTTTVDRLTEIEAIYQDLEDKRFDALYRGDRDAFSALFANAAYLEASLGAFDLDPFEEPPIVETIVVEVVRDDPGCLAAWIGGEIDGIDEGKFLTVLQPTAEGRWGYAFGGEGWLCEGSHPLEP